MQTHCRVDACKRPIHLKRDKLCNAHYLQQRKGQEFTTPRNTIPLGSLVCSFEPCRLPQNAKGLCVSHYAQQNSGRPLKPLYSTQRKRGTLAMRDSLGRKECAGCKQWHDPSDFGPSAKNTDGLRSDCRYCRMGSYAANRDQIIEARVLRYFNITVADPRPDASGARWRLRHMQDAYPWVKRLGYRP